MDDLRVSVLTAVVTVGLSAARRYLERRARRAGRKRTRAGDWKPRTNGAAVWLTDDDHDEGDGARNGQAQLDTDC